MLSAPQHDADKFTAVEASCGVERLGCIDFV